ncbi:hypothetical protein E2C06_34555, partial [Dankookia rubra]
MTCAHVVNHALGLDWNAAARPTEPVWVEFPFAQAGSRLGVTAGVVEWRAPGEGPATDIAVLELERDVQIRPYRTSTGPPERGWRFWTKGFPAGHDSGMDAAGEVGTPIEHGRLLTRGDALPGFFIEGGFSGAPLLDDGAATNAVLGMAAEAERDQGRRIAIVVPAEQLELAWPPLARPYKGLGAFQEADARFFHGREHAVEELANKVRQLPFVAIVGRSGSGKSSLVRAGLVPRLRVEAEALCVVTFRPGAPSPDPFRNLAAALIEATYGGRSDALELLRQEAALGELAASLRGNPDSIVEHLQRLTATKSRLLPLQLLLIVDQFEELFTVVPDPAENHPEQSLRARFVRCLEAATDTSRMRDPAARCVITIRADYIGRALGMRKLADALRNADVKLGPMTAAELRRAIEEPARTLGITFENGLVDELMQAVGGSGDALPLLEFTLTELWSEQRGRVIRRASAVRAAEADIVLASALTRHAEAVFENLSRRFGEASCRKVLTSLVWLGDPSREGEDTRRVRRRGEFGAREWELVEQFAGQDRQARLVATGASHVSGEPTAEIVHDAMLRHWKRLRGWLDEDRAFRLWLQKIETAAEEWRRTGDASDLLQGRRLIEAERWRDERAAEDLRPVVDYVEASVRRREMEREQQERARQEQITALKAERAAAERAAQEAEAQRRAARWAADEAVAHRAAAERAAAEAQDHRRRAELAAAEADVQRAVAEAARARERKMQRRTMVFATFATLLAIVAIGLWSDADAQRKIANERAFRAHVVGLAGLADGEAATGDAVTALLIALQPLLEVPDNEPRGTTAEAERAAYNAMLQWRELALMRGHVGAVHLVAFSLDGRRLATASWDGTARVWDAQDGRELALLRGHGNVLQSVSFSPDGGRLATASWDGTARLWDAQDGRELVQLRGHGGAVLRAAFSPDGRRLATASADGTARLWDTQDGRELVQLRGHGGAVHSVAFSPDGRRLATASADGTARLWDTQDGRELLLRGHGGAVHSVAFSP